MSEVDDDYVLIAHISDRGLYDGFILRELADIQHIETGGEYEEMIGKLYKLKKQSHRKLNIKETPCLMDALLEHCCKEKLFIAIKFLPDDESSIRGALQEAGDVLIIQRYFNAGIKDALV